MKLFMTLAEIADLFGCPETAALDMLERYNVRPVDYGRGRGRGKRWYAPAIQQMAADMHDDAQQSKPRSSKKLSFSDIHPITGKSKKELKFLLTGCAGPVQ